MRVSVIKSHPPVTHDALVRAEKLSGATFPSDYRSFVLSYNGGKPKPSNFNVEWAGQDWSDGWESSTVDWFLAFDDGGHSNFFEYMDMFKKRIPLDMIPIALDPGGSLVVMSVSGEDCGRVFFWAQDHQVEDGEIPDRSNVGFVANSFSEFLDSLY